MGANTRKTPWNKKTGEPTPTKRVKPVRKARANSKVVKKPQVKPKPVRKARAKSGVVRGRPTKYPIDGKITLLVKRNPKTANGTARKRFGLYKDGMTPAQYIEAGGMKKDIAHDILCKFIKVTALV